MKTLIAYASKYGTTEKCAKDLATKLDGEVDFLDLKISTNTDLNEYEKVIVGGSINAGRIQPQTRKFIAQYQEALKEKKLGLFICCGAEGDEALRELNENYPKELLDIAVAKNFFGGEIKLSAMPGVVRFIVKKMSKTDVDKDMLLPENIKSFATEMNMA